MYDRLQALHYAQLVCQMMSGDPALLSPEEKESVALALVIIAKHLHQTVRLNIPGTHSAAKHQKL